MKGGFAVLGSGNSSRGTQDGRGRWKFLESPGQELLRSDPREEPQEKGGDLLSVRKAHSRLRTLGQWEGKVRFLV